jgi:tetratricopeptide (TPR) repeat protein
LEPRALAKAADLMAAGDFVAALAEYSVLAAAQPEKVSLQFQAGLAALGAGDAAAVERWFNGAIETAVAAPNASQLLNQAITNLDDFVTGNPDVDGRAIRRQLEAAILAAQANDPAAAFADGSAALAVGDKAAAEALFDRGLSLSSDRRYFAPLKKAVFDLLAYPADDAAPIISLVREQLAGLTAAATDESDVAVAFDLATIAVAVQDWVTAGQWYNEAIRRTAVNNQYPTLRATRSDLYQLWSVTDVTSGRIMAAMEAAYLDQLAAYPSLNNDQLYWRFRAWFKYGLGLSAYRLDAEMEAAAALQAGQADADFAFDLNPGDNAYVQSYLTESAWGWYNITRGDDAYVVGDFTTALDFYERAVQAIQPERNNDAKADAITAVFKAALASVQLAQFDEAADWVEEGIQRADLYQRPNDINNFREQLIQIQESRPEWAVEIEGLLELLP